MLSSLKALSTKDAPQLPLSLTPKRYGGALAWKQEVGGNLGLGVPWKRTGSTEVPQTKHGISP